jgi:hypothetical protein
MGEIRNREKKFDSSMKIKGMTLLVIVVALWVWGDYRGEELRSVKANFVAVRSVTTTVPTPTYDPLATPVLPEDPSQAELGGYLYYFHCMPCHGDLGQGLTDEFRAVWEEDHQNCWARGCHTGRPQDEGFPIPTIVPPVISESDALEKFAGFESLKQYLHDTHPPQYPGKLGGDEYQALTAYLWEQNNKPALTATPRNTPPIQNRSSPEATNAILPEAEEPQITSPGNPYSAVLMVGGGMILLLVILFLVQRKKLSSDDL